MGSCNTSQMNGQSVKEPFPLHRVRIWLRAFIIENQVVLACLESAAKRAVEKLTPAERGNGDNCQHFLNTEFTEWFLACGELHVSATSGDWEESLHNDGGASILHLGLTLFGRRDLKMLQGNGLPDIRVPNVPGSVYFGGVTGAQHQVHSILKTPTAYHRHTPKIIFVD